MSIERELLKRFMTELKTEEDVVSLFNDIKECLAKSEKAVAECTNSDTWNCKYCNKTESCGALKDSRNFAPPKREPLSEEEIESIWWQDSLGTTVEFARAIKKAHGITGEDDESNT